MSLTTLHNLDDWFFDPMLPPMFPVTRKQRRVTPHMSLDMRENDHCYEVEVDIPGVSRENIKLSTEGRQLYISAERTNSKKSKDGVRCYFSERSFGVVTRVVPLPQEATLDDIKARYENGVLYITINKNTAKTHKSIEIE